jgi:hypothetical protein
LWRNVRHRAGVGRRRAIWGIHSERHQVSERIKRTTHERNEKIKKLPSKLTACRRHAIPDNTVFIAIQTTEPPALSLSPDSAIGPLSIPRSITAAAAMGGLGLLFQFVLVQVYIYHSRLLYCIIALLGGKSLSHASSEARDVCHGLSDVRHE